MLKKLILLLAVLTALVLPAYAQETGAPETGAQETGAQETGAQEANAALGPMQAILQEQAELIVKSSRTTIGPAIEAVSASGLPQAAEVLETWQAREMWQRKADGLFFRGEDIGSKTYRPIDFDTGEAVGEVPSSELKQIKPNSGIQGLIGTALVTFQLNDPSRAKRIDALRSLERAANADLLAPLRASIEPEEDAVLKARKQRLERLLTISYDPDPEARIAAIEEMSGDLGLDVRGALNPLTVKTLKVFEGEPPAEVNVARVLRPGS
ncbi:MAG: urea ABC transporter permease subunit UrtB, partial [Maritimibacter sp.]|nr:urea ABC transporter permease subunit UrtB [Maritimibacter sp.]